MRAPTLQSPSLVRACIGWTIGSLLSATGWADLAVPLGARLAVCFPPAAPIYGDTIMGGAPSLKEGHFIWSPPPSLAEFVHETFYPPLSTRLMARSLGSRLEERLASYRLQRGTLLRELSDQILALHPVDPAIRETELRHFATRQNPRILALETFADDLRRSLIEGSLLQGGVGWSERRRWRIGATRFANEPMEQDAHFQIVRAAAYYENGFTIEQRGLLLEAATELHDAAREQRPGGRTRDPAAIFFSPGTAQLRLPQNATPKLTGLLGRFNRAKADLKQELREAVLAHDRAHWRERALAFEALAERQWPRLVELENLADVIRAELAAIPPIALRPGPHIPSALQAQIESYEEDERKLSADLEEAVRLAMDQHRAKLSMRPTNERERKELARLLAEDRTSLRAKIAQGFEEESRERFQGMRQRQAAIQEQLKVMATGQSDGTTGEPFTAETLLRNHEAAQERFDAYGREEVIYREYGQAMLMLGLSPEQRRLLFGLALVGLAQPLPAGETMPTGTQPTPRP